MELKVLKPKEALSVEEALDVKGGLNSALAGRKNECTCNCWIGNRNMEPTIGKKEQSQPNM